MALSMSQIEAGAVVEHYHSTDPKTGKLGFRNPIRRGVIHHTEDDAESGGLQIWVQFKREGGAEKVKAAELNIVHGPTRDTLKIIRPTGENSADFAERDNKDAKARILVEDELKLGRPMNRGKVAQ